MAKLFRKLWLIVSVIALAFPYLFRMVQWLGDVDTVCSIAEVPAESCGSGAIVGFILAPPVWMISLSVVLAFIAFWCSERQREKAPVEKLDGLHSDFWELSAKVSEFREESDARFDRIEHEVAAMQTELRGKASQRSLALLPQEYRLEIEGAVKKVDDNIRFLRQDLEQWQRGGLARFHENLGQTPPERLKELIENQS